MTSHRPRNVCTASESAVVDYLSTHGFPHAEWGALCGYRGAGDIANTPGICWSVKVGPAARSASDELVEDWLHELDEEADRFHSIHGILVVQRRGHGRDRVGRWWAITRLTSFMLIAGDEGSMHEWSLSRAPVRVHLADMCELLRHAGWGTEVDT